MSTLCKASDLLDHPGKHQTRPGLVLATIGDTEQSAGLIGATAQGCSIWLARMALLGRSFFLSACAPMADLGRQSDLP